MNRTARFIGLFCAQPKLLSYICCKKRNHEGAVTGATYPTLPGSSFSAAEDWFQNCRGCRMGATTSTTRTPRQEPIPSIRLSAAQPDLKKSLGYHLGTPASWRSRLCRFFLRRALGHPPLLLEDSVGVVVPHVAHVHHLHTRVSQGGGNT